ncbi:uncharacterized protein At3g28850-like [Euphorbia lathyris]|uniref:uncharacterized protein At3g28850-like n=1 Tax=Euphorbia lathyris TaxID=212925 RepID=UPI00331426B8
MKGVKGKLLKKLKSIKPIGYLKPDRVLHVNASDGFVETFQINSVFKLPQTLFMSKELSDQGRKALNQEPDVIDVEELMRDLEEEEENEEMEVDSDENVDKENIGPPPIMKKGSEINMENSVRKVEMINSNSINDQKPLSERDILSFRRPDLNSGTLFDPNLLAAFEEAVKEHARMSEAEKQARSIEQNKKARIEEEEPPLKTRRIEEEEEEEKDPLLGFEEKCPPGGSDSVILYTTTLRGIRKTFEECNSIRFLLESFGVIYFERDVSMHIEYKEELWEVLEGKIMPPRLFIKGRYIGGADQVLRLHESGHFRVLFEGIPIDRSKGPCESCAGFRFVVCFKCNGSHRIIQDNGFSTDCVNCNENGLLICPLCC